jgi:hypothetical protein
LSRYSPEQQELAYLQRMFERTTRRQVGGFSFFEKESQNIILNFPLVS